MARWIVVLSGPIRSGKTTLAAKLSERFGMKLIKTHDLIKNAYSGLSLSGRISLQEYGEKLDRSTRGKWIANELGKIILADDQDSAFIVDSARIPQQVDAIRLAFRPATHIHLTASEEELRKRYEKRAAIENDPVSYDEAKKNKTERGVERLAKIADIVIDTGRCTDEDVFVRATSRMGLYKHDSGYVDVVVGGQFGSEGKGQLVNFLTPEYDVIVRVGVQMQATLSRTPTAPHLSITISLLGHELIITRITFWLPAWLSTSLNFWKRLLLVDWTISILALTPG